MRWVPRCPTRGVLARDLPRSRLISVASGPRRCLATSVAAQCCLFDAERRTGQQKGAIPDAAFLTVSTSPGRRVKHRGAFQASIPIWGRPPWECIAGIGPRAAASALGPAPSVLHMRVQVVWMSLAPYSRLTGVAASTHGSRFSELKRGARLQEVLCTSPWLDGTCAGVEDLPAALIAHHPGQGPATPTSRSSQMTGPRDQATSNHGDTVTLRLLMHNLTQECASQRTAVRVLRAFTRIRHHEKHAFCAAVHVTCIS